MCLCLVACVVEQEHFADAPDHECERTKKGSGSWRLARACERTNKVLWLRGLLR